MYFVYTSLTVTDFVYTSTIVTDFVYTSLTATDFVYTSTIVTEATPIIKSHSILFLEPTSTEQ